MRTPGNRTAANQRRVRIALFNLKARLRRFSFLTDANDTFAALQNVFQQRCLHHFGVRLPLPAHQRQIILLHPFFAQLFMQRTQCGALLRHQQYAGGIAVKAVNQFEETGFRTQRAQAFNDAETQAAAAVHRGTGRFIQHQNMVILIQNHIGQRRHLLQMRGDGFFFTLGNPNGRNADFVAGFQLVFRLDAFFIHPHLAFTQDAINHALRYAL